MDKLTALVHEFEVHDLGKIREYFEDDISPNAIYRGRPLIEALIGMYMRSPRFKDCVGLFVEYGLVMDDEMLLAVLLDDANRLSALLSENPEGRDMRYTLPHAYIPMREVSLLHVCAEYNHTHCAAVLLEAGLSVDVRAGRDEFGFGGQTPVFHTVNQNWNNSREILDLLLDHSPDLGITIQGLIWGEGHPWETLIPAVNPISYAMMGLLPQFHRREEDIAEVVSALLKHRYGLDYTPKNVPCAYLSD
jgi:hypothetical protein